MENEILFEIRKRYDGFRKSEKKVADFLMNFEGPLSSLNLELTAKRAGVSQPTVVRFAKALKELQKEGGIPQRAKRYEDNNRLLIEKMAELGIRPYITEHQGPIITTFF